MYVRHSIWPPMVLPIYGPYSAFMRITVGAVSYRQFYRHCRYQTDKCVSVGHHSIGVTKKWRMWYRMQFYHFMTDYFKKDVSVSIVNTKKFLKSQHRMCFSIFPCVTLWKRNCIPFNVQMTETVTFLPLQHGRIYLIIIAMLTEKKLFH